MEPLLLEPSQLLDPEMREESGDALLVEDGRIEARIAAGQRRPSAARRVPLPGLALAPGFLDLHFHGALIFTPPEQAEAALRAAGAALLSTGVTAYLPTTVTWPAAELSAHVSAWARAAAALASAPDCAAALGLHLEGPWIRLEAAGAQPKAGIRPYCAQDRELLDRSHGLARLVTLAPETAGAGALLAELARRDIVPSLGHSLASREDCARAVSEGARHVTHLFNAMGAFHQRAPGLIGAALADDRLSCDLICDGAHVHPTAVALAARAKGDRLALITDNVAPSAAGFGGGAVHDDGVALRLADGTLAGSRLTLDRALANARAFVAWSRLESVRSVTLVPARVLGIEGERGTLRLGARADFAMLAPDGSVMETWIGGQPAWRRGEAA